jgi:hypothetical protein
MRVILSTGACPHGGYAIRRAEPMIVRASPGPWLSVKLLSDSNPSLHSRTERRRMGVYGV